MPLNEYDELISGRAPERNEYDDLIAAEHHEQTIALKQSMRQASTTTPDQAAEARHLADQFRVPVEVVSRNLDRFRQRKTTELHDYDQLIQETPALASFLQNPHNATVAQDDLPNLSAIERTLGIGRNLVGAVGEGLARIGQSGWGVVLGLAETTPGGLNRMVGQLPGPTPTIPAGQVMPGNINLAAQPKVQNPDGSISTVDSFSVNIEGREVLLPTVTPDGRHLSQEDAIKEYEKTKRHLGMFETPAAADAYAQQLHEEYAAGKHEPPLPSALAEYARANAAIFNVLATQLRGPQTGVGFVERHIYGGVTSIVQNIPGIMAGLATGGVATGLAIAGASTAGQSYATAREQGLDVTSAQIHAGIQGAIEMATEEIPLSRLLGDAAKKSGIIQTLAHQLLPELGGEQIATFFQDMNEWAFLPENKDRTWADYWRERPSAAAATLISTIVAVGGQTVATHATARVFEQLGESAKASKTIQRSPAAAEDFIAQATKDGPNSHVYAPIDTFNQYWQSQGVNPADIAADLTGDPTAYQTAVQTGQDLVIPTARYATRLANTEHNAFFAQELRLQPDQMNAREAAAFEADQAKRAETAAEPSPAAAVRTAVLEQLAGVGVPRATAERYAALYESTFGSLAERAGVDPLALYEQYGLTVKRPDLEAARPPTEVLPAEQEKVTAGIKNIPGEAVAAAAPTPEARIQQLETELRAAQRALEMDPLTGVASRAAFDKAIATAEADPNTAVIAFDANNFGQVNKQLGHEAGDTMLREMASAIKQAATEYGVGERVFRRGGDEFVVLAPTDVAEAVRERAEALFGAKPAGTVEISLSGNVGETFAVADATLQAVKAARKRAPNWAPTEFVVDRTLPTPETGGTPDAAHPSEAGQRPADRAAEQPGAVPEGPVEGRGAEHGADRGRVSTPGLPDVDEVFERRPVEENQARLTPEVRRELARMLDEMETFPFVERTWTWVDGPKTGNAAGGAANVVAGAAGAAVYDDILAFSPVNKFRGKAARQARGTRGVVTDALRTLLETNDVPTNLAEGALRVAEHRARNDYSLLAKPELPHRDATPTTPEFLEALEDAFDDAIDRGEGDISFNPDEFQQLPPEPADTLDTGEVQPRLPGDVGEVRTKDVATPEFEAPFSLTSEVAKPKKLKSPLGELFQIDEEITPLATLTGAEFAEGVTDIKTLRTAAIDYYTRELQHGLRKVERPGFGVVTFTDIGKKEVKSSSANPKKLRLVPAIPNVILHGTYSGRQPVEKPGRTNIAAFHYFTGTVLLAGERTKVGVTVIEDRAGNKFYNINPDPEILRAKKKARVASQSQAGAAGPSEGATDTLEQSIDAGADGVNLDILGQPDQPRGAVPKGTYAKATRTITLLERADLSTFLHESGHFFLELLADLSERGEASPQIQQDMRTLLDWFGHEGDLASWRAQTTDQQRDAHEQFARGFEAYLMEGKAPSLALRDVFASFRAWLVGVYRTLRGLNVTLTPEVRQVFDRMLASDAAIAEAEAAARVEPIFLTAEQAGMSEAVFARYRDRIADAARTARETLDAELLAEVQRTQTATWKAQRAAIEEAVTTETHAQPVYKALWAMQRGTFPDGSPLEENASPEPLKLSKAILVERYGKARLKTLPRPYVYTREGGLDPDVVAELYGFSSGDALLTAIAQAPPMGVAIQQQTDARMLAEHGSMLLDGTLPEQARAAVANESREEVIRAELKALAQIRREGRKVVQAAIPSADVVRRFARERIAGTKVREIRPHLFWAAARRAATEAFDAVQKQDYQAAGAAKQQELVNLALYREAIKFREEREAGETFARDLGKGSARQRLGLAGETYLDQVDGVLDRYEFARVSQKVLDRRASLRKWVAAQEGEGLPIDLPEDVLEETRRVNYQDLTVEEFRGVIDGLKQLAHLARLKNRLLKAKDQRELEVLATTLGESIRDHAREARRQGPRDRRPAEERRRTVEDWFAGHRKLASMLREMDGFEDGGAAWDAIMRPLNEAADREAEMNAAATQALGAIVNEAYPGRQKRDLYIRREIPAINDSLSKMERLMVALNWGNEGNRQRVRAAERWTDQQVQAVLDTLDERDWTFVQGVWDFLDSYWSEIAAKQKRVYGVAPEKVDATPVATRFGEQRGGYFPLKYDDRLSASAIAALDLEAANLAKQAAYTQATTRRGHTKERQQNVKLPVRRDFGVIFEHVTQVIHDLSHHEALIDVGRVLGHRAVQTAILETQGDLVYKQIRGAVRDVAFGTVGAVNGFEKAVNHVRAGATVAGLAWNLTTAFLQPIGLTNSMVRIGPKWVAKGLVRWLRSPTTMVQTVEWIGEKSTMMKLRGQTQQREITEIRQAVGVNTGKLTGWVDDILAKGSLDQVSRQGVADSYFWMIQQMQRVADVPTWLGQYEKAMAAGETEDRAIAMADQAVLDSQGGGQIKDLAQVQRGGPMMKLWTNFYSFFNVLYNQSVESTKRTNFKHPVEVGRLAADYMMLFIVPATLGFLLRRAMRPGDDDDDLGWSLLMENLSYISGLMLGVREISGTLQGYYGYEGPAGARAFAALSRLGQQVQQGKADSAFWKALNDTAGIVLHYPAGQVRRTLDGITAIAEGKTKNPFALVAGGPKKATTR